MKQRIWQRYSFEVVVGILLICGTLVTRFIDLPYNFSPVLAIALFCGFLFDVRWTKMAVPLLAMFISDLLLNNFVYSEYFPHHKGPVIFADHMIGTYAALILIVWVGSIFLKSLNIKNITIAALIGAITFFVVTNFYVWLSSGMYSLNGQGFIRCYIAALPFFRATLISNILFCYLLFGTFKAIVFIHQRYYAADSESASSGK